MGELSKNPGNKGGESWDDLVKAGPGTPLGVLLRQFWQPVAVGTDLARQRAVPIRVLNEDLTLYRGEGGNPHLVDSRCAHRLTLLHTGWVQGETIRCRYHGWRYDGNGQCVEMPAEDPIFPPKIRIKAYPAVEYAGLIFAYLGTGEPPPFPRKAELDRTYGHTWATSMTWPCNWFQRIENSLDAVHVSFVHQDSPLGESVSYTVPNLSYKETAWGLEQVATRSADNVRINEFNWPNCNHIVTPVAGMKGLPWMDIFNWFLPVDDENSVLFTARSAPLPAKESTELREKLAASTSYNPSHHAEELFRGEMPTNVLGGAATSLINAQDYIVQVGQGTIVDRAREHLGKSDEGIIFLRKIFWRELEQIKQGRPGKRWEPRTGFSRLPVPPHIPAAPDA